MEALKYASTWSYQIKNKIFFLMKVEVEIQATVALYSMTNEETRGDRELLSLARDKSQQ